MYIQESGRNPFKIERLYLSTTHWPKHAIGRRLTATQLLTYLYRKHIAKDLTKLAVSCGVLQQSLKYAYQERVQRSSGTVGLLAGSTVSVVVWLYRKTSTSLPSLYPMRGIRPER
jgi:hypothetical protein